MKKFLFVLGAVLFFCIIAALTPADVLGYNFPGDEGVNKMIAAMVATFVVIAGAVVSDLKAGAIWVGGGVFIAAYAGGDALIVCLVGCIAARLATGYYPELIDFILTPLKPDEDEKKEKK